MRYVCTSHCNSPPNYGGTADVPKPIPSPQELLAKVAASAPDAPTDPVQRPAHYARFPVEPIYFIMKNNLSFAAGNVIKYLCRYDAKDGLQDLKKARRYLDMLIKQLEGDDGFAD